MKKRSNFQIMWKLSGLVKPLAGYMVLAILMGLAGNLCATFISVLGGYAILHFLGLQAELSLTVLFVTAVIFEIIRGILRYA